MEWLLRIFEGLFIGIGIPLCLGLLARLFPFKPQIPTGEPLSFDELKSKYSILMAASAIPYLVFCAAGYYPVYRILVWTLHQSLPNSPENRYLMPFYQRLFLLPAFFYALCFSAVPTESLYRLKLKEKYAEYILYGNLLYGYDTWKVAKILMLVTLTPCAIFTILAMDCYVRVTDDQIITNRFLGFGETAHNYSQVTRIKSVRFSVAPGDNGRKSPYHVVHFSDGSSWSTINGLYQADQNPKLSYEKEREIFAFVAKKCGKEIERYDFLKRDEDP